MTYLQGALSASQLLVETPTLLTASAATPYALLTTDASLSLNADAAFTVTLPAAPATGRIVDITDRLGLCNTNNIIIDGNMKNINGAATLTMNQNYASVKLQYNGTQWNII